ncbi:hypothetical protein A2U01_0080857, partial [Trifolium medium]|nr:hypothetical protein [Trifolium medium]
MTRDEGVDMVNSFLGVDREDVKDFFAETNGVHLKHTFVETIYTDKRSYADKALAENKPMHVVKL